MAWVPPRTWVNGTVTAAMMNEISSSLHAIGDAWIPFTPSWTAGTTAPSLGNGTATGAYSAHGKTIHFRAKVTMGSTTTYGAGSYFLTVPFQPLTGLTPHLEVFANDVSAGTYYTGKTYFTASTTVGMAIHTTLPYMVALNPSAPFTWATGDSFEIYGTYESN
jgi:hypothetical protein